MPSGTAMPPGGKQCRRERQACGSTFSGGVGQRAFLCPLISNFDKRYGGEGGWRAASPSCPPAPRVYGDPSNGCSFRPLAKADILHRENTSPRGFFSFIVGIS